MLKSLEYNLQSEKQSRLQIIKGRGLEGLLVSALSLSALQGGCAEFLKGLRADREYDKHVETSLARSPEEYLGFVDLAKYLAGKTGDVVVRVPCNYSGQLHIHDINVSFVPLSDVDPRVYVNSKFCPAEINEMSTNATGRAISDANALLKYGRGTVEEEAQHLHLIQAKVTYSADSKTHYDRDNIFVVRTAQVSFRGTTGCKSASLPEPFVVDTNTLEGWELLHRVISEDAKLKSEYEASISRFVDNNNEEIVRLAREGIVKIEAGESKKPVWLPPSWEDGSAQRNLKEIANNGVIPPMALPIPGLRNYLNNEINKSLKESAWSDWKEK